MVTHLGPSLGSISGQGRHRLEAIKETLLPIYKPVDGVCSTFSHTSLKYAFLNKLKSFAGFRGTYIVLYRRVGLYKVQAWFLGSRVFFLCGQTLKNECLLK